MGFKELTQVKLPPPPAYTGPAFKKFDFAVVDFETEAIERRPGYPPVPVGVALDGKYWAWGHPEGNNCTKVEAGARLKALWRSGRSIVCHHAKFDMEVAEKHFDLPLPAWDRIHDTAFLLFLHDPHARSLELKPSAERLLGIKPEERDVLKDWVLANVRGAKKSEWGAHISKAPVKLVGPYAKGDLFRTKKIFEHLMPLTLQRGMMPAYDRERRVMPIFLRNEQVGIRLDVDNLEMELTRGVCIAGREYLSYTAALEYADNWIRRYLKDDDLNVDTDKDLGEALARVDAVTEWTWTKGGKNRPPQRSVGKKNLLISHFRDRKLALVYAYRNRLATCLRMFMGPWLEMGRGGVLSTSWNQVRGNKSGDGSFSGTRTGRPSTDDPNFLAISKDFEDKDDGYVHPKFMAKLPPLPLVRKYLLPDKGELWGHRDYNQQELRVLGHFEKGRLRDSYSARPYRDSETGKMKFDVHTTVQDGVKALVNLILTRTGTKILNFSDVYGKGRANLAESLGVSLDEVDEIRDAKNKMMPGVPALIAEIKRQAGLGWPIRTWGGREYYEEAPKYVEKFGRVMDFKYKLLNYLIQGSSAEITKEALIRYDEHPLRQGRFLVTVYDEINSSMHPKRIELEMRALREAMESIECSVPMLSDGKLGPNWGTIKGCWKELKVEREDFKVIKPWWN